MKKISSAIFLLAFFVFTNCKNNAELAEAEAKNQAAKDFYHAIIKLGYGFVDVFNAIGGLVSDVFYKADPKKSDVKNYFDSIAKILKDTQAKLDALSKEQGGGDGGTQVVEASKKAVGWIKEMHKAVEDTAKAGTGSSSESIANVATGGGGAAGAGKKADAGSVTGIAKGMKAIVAAAEKAGVEFKPGAAGGAGGANAGANAGRLFASGNAGNADNAQGAAEAAGKAVSAVSGDQILKAIVDAAETTGGKGAAAATNAVEAAIGDDGGAAAEGAAFAGGMQNKNDQIAAAIVLRGLAKDGKFANANNAANTKVVAAEKASGWIKEMHKAVEDTAKAGDGGGSESIANVAAGGAAAAGAGKKADAGSVTGIAKGMKAIVAAAGKAGVEFKPDPAAAGAGAGGANAGKLFASGANAHAGAHAGADANAGSCGGCWEGC